MSFSPPQPLPSSALLPEHPEAVPEQVSPALLQAVLARGRPPTSGRVEVAGVRCPIGSAGRGHPVLLVHGLGHDSWDWGPLVARAPEGLLLRWLDLPGFGQAGKLGERDWGLALLVDAVLALAATCERPPLVVGSSLGGHVAMLAALKDPTALAGLLLVSTGGLEHVPPEAQAIARGYYSVPSIVARPDADIVANSRRIFAAATPKREELATRKLCIHRSPRSAEFARPFAEVVDDVFRHPVAERIAELKVPARLLFGEKDLVVDPAMGRRAAETYGLPLEILDGVGHLPAVEDTERFERALLVAARAVFGG